jgi:hypothetical protein
LGDFDGENNGEDHEEDEGHGLDLGPDHEFSKSNDEDEEDMEENFMSLATESEEVNENEELAEAEEVVEVTNEDLKAALSEVLGSMKLKTEAQVVKGFPDVEDVDAGGLMDKASGEKQWSDVSPPAAKDWTVREAAYKKVQSSLVSEVKKLRTEVKKYKEAYDYVKRNLQETNLFNSKLLFTNKILHSAKNLNREQQLHVVESIDKAENLREVEIAYESLSEALKIAGVLGESKKVVNKTLKGPKASRLTTPSSTVLTESREANGETSAFSRMQELAGLID